jgi:light-regulated signal transduction histidine kinase (bacteriophytochrome)
VFQNLISNGFTYNRSQPPKVNIGASRDGDHGIVRTRDNGIGIDPSMTLEIFRPFRRLHGRNEFSGTGAGLPLARIVSSAMVAPWSSSLSPVKVHVLSSLKVA